jgi:hypothetical protein
MLFADAPNAPPHVEEGKRRRRRRPGAIIYREDDIGRYIDVIISGLISAMSETTNDSTWHKNGKNCSIFFLNQARL